MSDKKVCQVCRRPICCTAKTRKRCQMKGGECHGGGGCTSLGYERLAAILTPEVLRLIEAGRKYSTACKEFHALPFDTRGATRRALNFRAEERASELRVAAIAPPFEKPAECNHTEKQQLPKKGGEP